MWILKSPLILAFFASIFFAGSALSLKLVTGTGPRSDTIIWLGATGFSIGCVWKFVEGGTFSWSLPFINYSILCGAFWTLGMICILLAFELGSVTLVTPMYNINTLWVMLAGLVFFKEYEKVSVSYALTGGVLVILGGIILGLAERR